MGKLAARHGVRVSLRPSPYGGTTAIVLMPNSHRGAASSETDADTDPGRRRGTDRMSAPGSGPADALALTGRRSAPPSLPEGATRRTEAPDDVFGLARDPAPAVPPPSFRLGSPPPRLGSPGLAGTGPGTPGAGRPPGPGTGGWPRPARTSPGWPLPARAGLTRPPRTPTPSA